MHDRSIEAAPQLYARIGGALYMGNIVLGIFAEGFVRNRLIEPDAGATAANIASNELLWRFGIAAQYFALVCAFVLAMIYYYLLRPVSKELNLAATFLRLVSLTIEAVAVLNLDTALSPLVNQAAISAFTPAQRNAMVTLSIRSYSHGFGIALLVLGFCFLIHGRLIFRSGYLPKLLGILIQVAGLSYLANSLALILSPPLANRLFPAVLLPAFVAELSLAVWLLVKGVDVPKWNERLANSGNGVTGG